MRGVLVLAMQNPLPFVVAGLVNGAVYALAALGLVFAYRVSGTVNFAHGALGMFAAFGYWQLNIQWGLPMFLALAVAGVLLPAVLGAGCERLVFSRLVTGTVFARTSATVALLLVLLGLAEYLWGGKFAAVPPLFPQHLISLPGVVVSVQQMGVVVVSGALVVALVAILKYTKLGLEVRAVVDRRDLAELRGVAAQRIDSTAWAVSFVVAALSGILLAPLTGTDTTKLTLVVVYSLVAVAIGGMSSLPRTVAGGVVIGLLDSLLLGYMPQGTATASARGVLPFALMLAAVLVQARRPGLSIGGEGRQGIRSLLSDFGINLGDVRSRNVGPYGVALAFVLVLAVKVVLGDFWLFLVGTGVAYGVIFLSFQVFTYATGLVSLAQGAFAGAGAFATAILVDGGYPWGIALLGGVLVGASLGVLVALPTARVRGIFMVLATLAFAQLVQTTAFTHTAVIGDRALGGSNGGRPLPRPAGLDGNLQFALFGLVIFVAAALLSEVVHRSSLGRALRADASSRAGAMSIGIRPQIGRLTIFVVSAGIAGLGGSLLAASSVFVFASTWHPLNVFVWLAVTAIGGMGSPWGALVGGIMLALAPQIAQAFPVFQDLYVVAFGVAGLLLIRMPGGIVGVVGRVITQLGRQGRPPLTRAAGVTPRSSAGSNESAELLGSGAA